MKYVYSNQETQSKDSLTATDLTALMSFLVSRVFRILLTWFSSKLHLNLMSRIQIPVKKYIQSSQTKDGDEILFTQQS